MFDTNLLAGFDRLTVGGRQFKRAGRERDPSLNSIRCRLLRTTHVGRALLRDPHKFSS
jgi:hypothetical protein